MHPKLKSARILVVLAPIKTNEIKALPSTSTPPPQSYVNHTFLHIDPFTSLLVPPNSPLNKIV